MPCDDKPLLMLQVTMVGITVGIVHIGIRLGSDTVFSMPYFRSSVKFVSHTNSVIDKTKKFLCDRRTFQHIGCFYEIAASAARSSCRSARGSPFTAKLAAL